MLPGCSTSQVWLVPFAFETLATQAEKFCSSRRDVVRSSSKLSKKSEPGFLKSQHQRIPSLLQYCSNNKSQTCVKGKADSIPAAA